MTPLSPKRFVCVLVAASAFAVTSAFADVTLHAHYTFVNGDTATRTNYYASHRMRMTSPDGREYLYDARKKRVAVIDHGTKAYWEGPMALADSIVDSLNAMRYRELMAGVTGEQKAKWAQLVASLNDSIAVHKGWEDKLIAGVHCTRWTQVAGSRMTYERWLAPSISAPNYIEDIQRVLLVSLVDPLGKGLAKMIIDAGADKMTIDHPDTDTKGLVLAASASFRTLTTSGSYSWETYRVDYDKIPSEAWKLPPDYRRMTWTDAKKSKR